MEVLPAIDLRDGCVVRLSQGDFGRQKTYSKEPAAVAAELARRGATWIHVVDLDAAKTGTPTNTAAIAEIRSAAPVVIGSAAMKDWPWFEKLACRDDMAGRIALGLDARDGQISIDGWTKEVNSGPVEIALKVKGWPLGAIIYTDIDRDGMLTGVNLESTREVVSATDVPIIASGGVSSLKDVRDCNTIGCAGTIVGRAYYEGKIDLAVAIESVK